MLFKKYILECAVFICGAVVMVFELTGSRILGPYLGATLYVWTSLIGVILGSLSFGYWIGGKIADRKADMRSFSLVIFLSALSIMLVYGIKNPILQIGGFFFSGSLELRSVLISLILFGPASVLLGIISPYAVRLRIFSVHNSAETVGSLYALSTLGSIAGTFGAGFFIIPAMGSDMTLLFLSFVLFSTAFAVYPWRNFLSSVIGLCMAFAVACVVYSALLFFYFTRITRIVDKDTPYNRVWIYESKDVHTNKNIINLSTDPFGTQSAIFVDSDDLVFQYTKFYRLVDHFYSNVERALMIGGCAYTYPRDFLARHQRADIDVVEIDPGMTEVAKTYFRLKDNPRLHIIHNDGRLFMNGVKEKTYDVIFNDAFTSISVPFHLTTKEAIQKQYIILKDKGVVFTNIISSVEGEKGEFLRAEYATYKSVFPHVLVFPVKDKKDGSLVQNIMIVALKDGQEPSLESMDKEFSEYLSHRWRGNIQVDMPLLTDDFAPVEHYRRKTL